MDKNLFKIKIYLPPTIFTFVIISLDGFSFDIIGVFLVAIIIWVIILWGISTISEKIYLKGGNLQEKVSIIDSNFGELTGELMDKSYLYTIKKTFFKSKIKFFVFGNKTGIDKETKKKLLFIFDNEVMIKSKVEKALKKEFNRNKIEFISIYDHFNIENLGLIVHQECDGFTLSFPLRQDEDSCYDIIFDKNNLVEIQIE